MVVLQNIVSASQCDVVRPTVLQQRLRKDTNSQGFKLLPNSKLKSKDALGNQSVRIQSYSHVPTSYQLLAFKIVVVLL